MKRRRITATIALFILTTSAIASAGIYGVMSVLRGDAAFVDDEDVEAGPVTPEDLAPPERTLPPPRAPRNADEGDIAVRVDRLSGGFFVPAARVDVQAVSNGQIIDRGTSAQNGAVRLELSDGIYSLVARGADGIAVARSVLTEGTSVTLALCPPVDMPAIDAILQNDVYGGGTVATLGDPIDPADWLNLLEGAGFVIQRDGTVVGRISRTEVFGEEPRGIVNTRVLFVRGNEIVAEGVTGATGEFRLSGLSPGAYSFVVASNLGFLALAVEVQAIQDGVVSARGSEVRFVSFDDSSRTNAEPAPPGDVQAAGGTTGGPGPGPGPGMGGIGPFGPFPPGGGGGGFSGGGGGFSGGGGGGIGGGGILGPLLAGLGGAALGWALGDDDDDDDTVSP